MTAIGFTTKSTKTTKRVTACSSFVLFVLFVVSCPAGLSTLLGGCGTVAPQEAVELDPLVIQADGSGQTRVVEVRPLFMEATTDYEEGRYEDAGRKYLQVAELFADTPYVPHALFNAGLVNQRLDHWPTPMENVRRPLPSKSSKLGVNAYQRLQ